MEKVKHPKRRSYGQFCGLARALDVVGDRWNLLIVRELLPGPLRYGELRAALGGIATNLLVDRLRAMEENGVVERQLGSAGIEYALTRWGSELQEAMEALGRWGAPLLTTGRGDDAFHPRWLVLALPAMLKGATASPVLEIGLEVDGYAITLRIDENGPHASADTGGRPDTVLTASPDTVVGLAAGSLTVDEALETGWLDGDVHTLRAVFAPRAQLD